MDRPEPIDPKMHWNRTADAVQRNSGRVSARQIGPGRSDVDEHSLDPFPGTKASATVLSVVRVERIRRDAG